LHAEHQDALGRRQPKLARLAREGHRAFVQPFLQHRQAADVREALVRGVILEQSALADDLLLFGKNLVHVIAAQAFLFHDDFGEHVFCLAQGQAQRRLQQPFAPGAVQINSHLLELAHLGNDPVEQRGQIFAEGSG